MQISVAMCTYNGARFVEEQIASIARQTRLPDELVVRDDRSTDDTPAILARLAAKAPFPIRWSVNPENLGSTRNFEGAIGACTGDLIFLCDQDDVWLPHKVEVMAREFEQDPGLGALFSDLDLVDEALSPLDYSINDHNRFTAEERARFNRGDMWDLLLDRSLVTGAALAFRRALLPALLPIPAGHRIMIHDRWIAIVAAAVSSIRTIDEPLALYRQHAGQQVGVDAAKYDLSRFGPLHESLIGYYDAIWDRLVAHATTARSAGLAEALRSRRNYYHRRITMPRSPLMRVGQILPLLLAGDYHRYGSGLRSAGRDLLKPLSSQTARGSE